MYGEIQESGLTEIIPLRSTSAICISTVSCAFSSWVSSGYTVWGGCNSWLLDGGVSCFYPEVPQGSSLGHCNVMAWWLQHPLFTDMAGNIFSLTLVTHCCPGHSYLLLSSGAKTGIYYLICQKLTSACHVLCRALYLWYDVQKICEK